MDESKNKGEPGPDFRVLDDEVIKTDDLVIATSPTRVLVRIRADGSVVYGPEYTPDEAARVLWQALARRKSDAEGAAAQREVVTRHMEAVLVAVGKADKAHEIAQMRAKALAEIAHSGPQAAAQAMAAQLEDRRTELELYRELHKAIELGRALDDANAGPTLKADSKLD